MIQKYYLRLENPLVSGRRELDPLSPPWQGGILPVNYARIWFISCYILPERGVISQSLFLNREY